MCPDNCRTLPCREEELQLVATYQEWKAVEQSLQAWAQGNGRPATLEVMADELGYPGGARQLRLLQRDALAAREEIHSSFIALIIKLAKVFEGCGMRQEDLVTVCGFAA